MVSRTLGHGLLLPQEDLLLPPHVCHPRGVRTLRTGCSTYHGEGFPGLLEQGLREQGDMYTLRDVHCPAVQVCDYNIQLEAAGEA